MPTKKTTSKVTSKKAVSANKTAGKVTSKKAASANKSAGKVTSKKAASVKKTASKVTSTKAKARPKKLKSKIGYSSAFLNEMRQTLLQMRNELLQEVAKSVKEESDHLRFGVGDFYDHASEDKQRELALILSNREREKLTQIDQALKKIEDGTYGICEVTENKIGEGRLKALPFATLSVEAQEEMEKGF